MEAAVERYLIMGQVRGWAPATVANYRHHLTKVMAALRRAGCQRWADVGPEDLDGVMADLEAHGIAVKSRTNAAMLMKGFFHWLEGEGIILRNAARTLPLPFDGEGALPPAPLSEDEVATIFRDLPRATVLDLRNRCFLELLYGCGLRISEALALRLEHVDSQRGMVVIHESKHAQSRIVPLLATARSAVEDYLALRRGLLRGPDLGVLLMDQRGKPWQRRAALAWFERLNARRGPEARHLHAHAFRHAIAVHLLRGGADIRYIQAFLGHACLDTTKVYLRLVPGQLREDYEEAMPHL